MDTGCWVFKWRVQNWKDFCLKINTPKGNHWILRIGVMGTCQKLSIIKENEVIKKLMLTKNVNDKNVLLIFHSSMEKKLRKIPKILDKKNWLWMLNFGPFWHLPITPILKVQSFPLGVLIFRQKYFQFCTPRLKTQQPVLPYSRVVISHHKMPKWHESGIKIYITSPRKRKDTIKATNYILEFLQLKSLRRTNPGTPKSGSV